MSRMPLEEFEIRSALGARIVQGATFSVGGFLAVVGTIALIGRESPWAGLAAGALVVWVGYFYRLMGLSVSANDDTLEVRNLFATRRITRSAVDAVTLGESTVAKSPNQTVVIHLADGKAVPLDACARTLHSPRKLRRVEEFQRRVTRWADPEETLAG
jgi:hypothetical protein